MVFRKGGHLGNQEKWYYAGKSMNMANSYTYLGFTFTTKLSYREGTSAFVAKGKKAVFHLRIALTRLKDMTRQAFIKYKKTDIKIQTYIDVCI